ncbi:hypothetical protein H8D36_02125 [archaeon]|nr:hypothetical protein [archaeon]
MQHFFDPWNFGTQIVYTIIIFIICFLIYFKTKEAYSLTKHRGIKYFRDAFLFFGLAYLVRFLMEIVFFSTRGSHLFIPRFYLFPIILMLIGYLSTIAILNLVFSISWKKINNHYLLLVGHIIAVVLAVVTFLTRSHDILAYLQLALLIVALVINFVSKKKKKKFCKNNVLYTLILIFWVVNLWIILPRKFLSLELKLVFEIVSLVVFIIIYFKVLKWLK